MKSSMNFRRKVRLSINFRRIMRFSKVFRPSNLEAHRSGFVSFHPIKFGEIVLFLGVKWGLVWIPGRKWGWVWIPGTKKIEYRFQEEKETEYQFQEERWEKHEMGWSLKRDHFQIDVQYSGTMSTNAPFSGGEWWKISDARPQVDLMLHRISMYSLGRSVTIEPSEHIGMLIFWRNIISGKSKRTDVFARLFLEKYNLANTVE